ncbi:MAG: ketose-bisphosphate aldolase [Streptococcaceae bacterium]|jgi:6-phospho-5-dehydro-2-deoxy-D-gluconate aldolase|nr:ketose-bisphosphate aldolase [Streptococcaceae bacterium]
MSLVTLKDVLPEAQKKKIAIGHFNVNGQLWMESILQVAQEENSPVIIASSDRMADYLGGFKLIRLMLTELIKYHNITVPVVLHLDHGQTVERCIEAIDAGYSSVMFDGSHKSLEENIELTKIVSKYAHSKGASIEAEIGSVGGNEDGIIGGIKHANLNECIELVEMAKVDALAAALGSVHGKYVGEPQLEFTEMAKISSALEVPLVLHGASGIPDNQIKKSIQLGHAKVNVNTELNVAWRDALLPELTNNPTVYEPRILLENSRKAIGELVREKIRVFRTP